MEFGLEVILFCTLLLVITIAELADKRKRRKRIRSIIDFTVRGSAATTNSHVDDALVNEFINKSDCFTSQYSRLTT